MENIKLITKELNGKKIAYSSETLFEVQIGKGSSSYKTRYSFTGDLGKAVFHYNCLNIGHGYKKRLRAQALNKPILARQSS